jgi:transcriptional regulator with XRE-family HTH domain
MTSFRVDKRVNPESKLVMEFGQILRRLRSAQGIGIKRLAPDLGVTYSYLSKLENGEVGPSEEFVGRVSVYFQYDKSELLLAAGKVPDDILEILRSHPQEAVKFLRKRFGENG